MHVRPDPLARRARPALAPELVVAQRRDEHTGTPSRAAATAWLPPLPPWNR